MLTLLKIRNLALVDELSWELGGGLIGVTGETGAGKSVIVGALKLVLGERADKGLIRSGEETCTVEAVFKLGSVEEVNGILDEHGVDACEENELIIRRVVGSGTNRQFVNNSAVTLAMLKALGERLVDLHGPHDHQSLLSVERQLGMLDSYAGALDALRDYRATWKGWRAKADEHAELVRAERASEQELTLLRHQIEEIESAAVRPEEEREIEERYRRASNASRLLEVAGLAAGLLGGEDGGILGQLAEVQRLTRDLVRYDPAVIEVVGGLDAAVVEIQELERGLADYVGELEIDPAEARALEGRIHIFETLKRKYGPTLAEVVEHGREAAARLDAIENRGERLEALEAEVKVLRGQLEERGVLLGRLRRKAAPKLAREIAGQLKDLGFRQSVFEVHLLAGEAGPHGLEAVDFQFGPNPGEPMKPLRQIASSGEVSRVMLAVKSALAEQDATPLMVFDEIDANVGGEIARAVGMKMAVLGERHQVIAITHFPQVAAVAARHFVVEKEVSAGRTRSMMRRVEGSGRVDELVRMLGGGGASARAMAESLLEGVGA
jgi:DNA repair protein RecN (Recombination protein N)